MKVGLKEYAFIDIALACIITIVALITGLIASYQYLDKIKKERLNTELQEELGIVQAKVLEKTEDLLISQKESSIKLSAAQDETNRMAEELILAQKKINELQNKTIKEILGDGYPVVLLRPTKDKKLQYQIKNNSNYQLRINQIAIENCKILLPHTSPVDDFLKISMENYRKSTVFKKNINVLPNNSYFLNAEISGDEIQYIRILIKAQHIITVQYSIFNIEGKMLYHDYKIFELSDNNYSLLYETKNQINIDVWKDNFPFKINVNINDF